MDKSLNHFNIRVYGILWNEDDEILVSDEYVLDQYMVKFPGGGLKFGEGPEDCIKREAVEEFGQEVEIVKHFYTTGFFQKALFYEDHQLISIYYEIVLKEKPRFRISDKPFDFKGKVNGNQSFRWVDPKRFNIEELSFPIDRYVMEMIRKAR